MRLWLAVFALQRAAAFATPRRVSARHRRMPTAAAKTVAEADTPVDGERAVVREVAGMALPLLLVSLSSPLLSLIDVAVVGRHVGVLGLASLGPATSVCDLSMYVFNALSVSTTRLAAAALADGTKLVPRETSAMARPSRCFSALRTARLSLSCRRFSWDHSCPRRSTRARYRSRSLIRGSAPWDFRRRL